VVRTSEDPYAINSRLLEQKIVGGFPLKKFYPELGNAALWCCTEMTTRKAIDTAIKSVADGERSAKSSKEPAEVQEVVR
jgi:glycine cleavage system P protein (glycine dehydrogenase) subunit 1